MGLRSAVRFDFVALWYFCVGVLGTRSSRTSNPAERRADARVGRHREAGGPPRTVPRAPAGGPPGAWRWAPGASGAGVHERIGVGVNGTRGRAPARGMTILWRRPVLAG